MASRSRTQNGAPSHVKLVAHAQGATSDSLNFLGAEIRDDGFPLPDSSGSDVQRPRDIRGSLKVIENVLFQHGTTFTRVKNELQPKCKLSGLTLVDMEAKLSSIADRLISAMREAGDISDSELARACSVSPAAVHKWKNGGKLSADSSDAAARALGVREVWLRTGKLPRERDSAEEDRQIDQIVEILTGLQGPLTALAAAIQKLEKVRETPVKRRRGSQN